MSIQKLPKTFRSLTSVSIWTFKRFKSTGKCASYNDPICSKETLSNQKPCPSKMRRLEAKEELIKKNSMWENPECCKDPCPEYYPRCDELYYEISDKLKRKYQQTWVDCPKLRVQQKKLCSHEIFKFLPMERRERNIRPKTACPIGCPRICMDKRNLKCPRVLAPGCRVARSPPKCKRERSISDCFKECTPYPSYSECLRQKQDPPDPAECKCLNHPLMCEVWAEMRRRMTFVKG